jgi:hypothetical protein
MAIPQQIDKPSYNEEFRICDFTNILGTDTINAASVVIYDSNNVDVSATMISDVTIYTGNKAIRYKLKGGTTNSKYKLFVRATTVAAQKFEEPFIVCIS